jgi:hypothetical protein
VYFRDLSLYQYGRAELRWDLLNVGWLSIDEEFPRGTPDKRFVTALQKLCSKPVNRHRGSHLCEFCPRPPTVLSKGGIPMLVPPHGTTGNGEIRVTGANGKTYVAPVLILHYVVEHQYLPPEVFTDAVLALGCGAANGIDPQCPWELIARFTGPRELTQFHTWMDDQIAVGQAVELPTPPDERSLGWRHFQHVPSGQEWVLTAADGPLVPSFRPLSVAHKS